MENENKAYPDMCICCGEPIPEGRMVCYACENGHKPLKEAKLDKLRVGDCLDDCGNGFQLPVIELF